MSKRLRVRYRRPFDVVADHDGQWARGGMLVRVEPPPGLALFDAVDVEIVLPDGAAHVVKGQVVQLVPGAGVAVAFQVPAGLTAAVTAARAAGSGEGPAPEHTVVAAAPPPAATPAQDAYSRVGQASAADKIQMALHGNKDERALILRDTNRTLHAYVLRNPNLQLDEVLAIAKMTTVSPEVLKSIAERREWAQRPEIAIALVRNPKTPTPMAVKLLDWVAPNELRQLAKDTRTRGPIQQAARKKVLG